MFSRLMLIINIMDKQKKMKKKIKLKINLKRYPFIIFKKINQMMIKIQIQVQIIYSRNLNLRK